MYADKLPLEISKLRGTGIEVFAVGIGNAIKKDELKDIASDPDSEHVISVHNFHYLKSSVSRLSHRLCPRKKFAKCNSLPVECDTLYHPPSIIFNVKIILIQLFQFKSLCELYNIHFQRSLVKCVNLDEPMHYSYMCIVYLYT